MPAEPAQSTRWTPQRDVGLTREPGQKLFKCLGKDCDRTVLHPNFHCVRCLSRNGYRGGLIIGIVASLCRIPIAVLAERKPSTTQRHNWVRERRYAAIWLCRRHAGLTFRLIGDLFRMDHSSVVYAYKAFDKRQTAALPANEPIAKLLAVVEGMIADTPPDELQLPIDWTEPTPAASSEAAQEPARESA